MPDPPAAFRGTDPRWLQAAPAEAQPRGEWWRVFGDSQLDALIDMATRNNTSIQAAVARLAKARSLTSVAQSGRLPQLGASAGVNQQGGPLINAAGSSGTLWTLTGTLSYEADLFGKLGREVDAAALDAQSREALVQNTRLLVQGDVAQTYFALRALDAERAALRDMLSAQREALRVVERRFELGSVAELDVARLRAEGASVQADGLTLERRRAELEHALALLLGEAASSFTLDEAEWPGAAPVIPPGIPSTVLARRPDISAAQRAAMAAQARLGAAKAAWFPALSLTTSQGFASPNLRDLVSITARAWGVGALLALPLFDGGRREAVVQGADADREAAVAAYREQVLIAFRDVEDQLSALRLLGEQERVQAQAVFAADRALTLAGSRYNSGLGSQLEVLDAQRTALRNRRVAVQVRAAQYQATVGLIRALGGGWGEARAQAEPLEKGGAGLGAAGSTPSSTNGPAQSAVQSDTPETAPEENPAN